MGRALAAAVDAEKLLPVRMTVTNKPGGGSAVAMAYLSEKKGEVHTIGIFTSTWVTNPLVRSEATITLTNLTPVVRLALEPALFVVKSDSPHKSVKEFIDDAKSRPGQLRQAGGSPTSRDSVIRQLLQKHTGAQWAFISFPGGGERIAALMGGHANLLVLEPQEAGEHIRAGNMRVIAQVADKRLPAFANIPTLKEAGFDIPTVPQARGVVAPPGIPRDVVTYWEGFFAKVVQTLNRPCESEDKEESAGRV
jgi:putative tricarboxylic transport membrane protein